MSAPPDARPRAGLNAPNVIQGGGVVSNQEVIRQEAARQQAEIEQARRDQAIAKAKRSRGGVAKSRSNLDQREADDQAVFSAFREAKAKGAKQGVDVTSATVRINKDAGTVSIGNVKGTESKSARRSRESKIVNDIIDQQIADIKGKGGKLNGAKITVNKTIAGNYSIKAKGVTFAPGELEYANPTYNLKFGSQKIGDLIGNEVEKGDSGIYGARPTFDKKDLDRFIGDYNFYLDKKTQRGAADFPIMTPASGFLKNNVFEGFGTYGEKQTTILSFPKVTYTESLIKEPLVKDAPKTGGIFEGFLAKERGDFIDFLDSFSTPATRAYAKVKGFSPDTVEAQPERDLTNLAARQFGQTVQSGGLAFGGKSDVTAADYSKVWENTQANKEFAFGSYAASVVNFIPDRLAGGIKFIGEGFKFIKPVEAAHLATTATETLKVAKASDLSIQAVKVSKSGIAVPLRNVGFNFSKKSVIFLPNNKPIVIPKLGFAKPSYYEVLDKEGGLLGTVNAKTGKTTLGLEPITAKGLGKLTGQGKISTTSFVSDTFKFNAAKVTKAGGIKVGNVNRLQKGGIFNIKSQELKADTATQIFESYGTGKQYPKALSDIEIDAAQKQITNGFRSNSFAFTGKEFANRGGIRFNKIELNISGAKNIIQPKALPKASENAGTLVEFDSKTVNSYLKGLKREADLESANKALLGDLKKLGKSTKRRKLTLPSFKPTRQSNAPLGSAYFTDLELKKAGESLRNALEKTSLGVDIKQSSKKGTLGLGGGANLFRNSRSLGFGGKTGAERTSKQEIDTELEIIRYPASATKGNQRLNLNIKSLLNEKTKPATRQTEKSIERLLNGQKAGSKVRNSDLKLISSLPKQRTFDLSKELQGRKNNFAIKVATGLRAGQSQAFNFKLDQPQITKQITRQNTKPEFKIDMPKLDFKLPKFAGGYRKGGKSSKGKKRGVVLREFEVKDLVSASLGSNSSFAKAFNKKYGKLF